MNNKQISLSIAQWPESAREAAQLVVDQYGEPDEITANWVVWHKPGPWKRIVASRQVHEHNFPAPHLDSVESVIDYRFPDEKARDIYLFDGSVVINRTEGEVSARCHDEQANLLALNLMHDIATGAKSVQQAREYYAHEFLNARRKQPTPYMEKLHFMPTQGSAADPDTRILTDEALQQAVDEGKRNTLKNDG